MLLAVRDETPRHGQLCEIKSTAGACGTAHLLSAGKRAPCQVIKSCHPIYSHDDIAHLGSLPDRRTCTDFNCEANFINLFIQCYHIKHTPHLNIVSILPCEA